MSNGPLKAYKLIRAYTADGEDIMAARIYAESSISLKRYMQAVQEGRQVQGEQA